MKAEETTLPTEPDTVDLLCCPNCGGTTIYESGELAPSAQKLCYTCGDCWLCVGKKRFRSAIAKAKKEQ